MESSTLTNNQARFVAEYMSVLPRCATKAYMRVFGGEYAIAGSSASLMMSYPHVQAAIAKWEAELCKDLRMDVEQYVRELVLVATADPRDLSERYIGSCRHCHGMGHQHQYTQNEFNMLLNAHIVRRARDKNPDPLGLDFDCKGGMGFNQRRAPHPECTECFGDGVGYEVFKDTRTLSAGAARLYAGVKKTRDGLEIKTRSPDKAIEILGNILGLVKKGVELTGPGGGPVVVQAGVATAPMPADPIAAGAEYRRLMGG